MRKTKKYYREIFQKDYYKALNLLKEAMDRYGKVTGRGKRYAKLKNPVSNNWNAWIEGFQYFKATDELIVEIYWQGDSTDGYSFVKVDPNKGILDKMEIAPAENHSWIRFGHYDIFNAFKTFANEYLR